MQRQREHPVAAEECILNLRHTTTPTVAGSPKASTGCFNARMKSAAYSVAMMYVHVYIQHTLEATQQLQYGKHNVVDVAEALCLILLGMVATTCVTHTHKHAHATLSCNTRVLFQRSLLVKPVRFKASLVRRCSNSTAASTEEPPMRRQY